MNKTFIKALTVSVAVGTMFAASTSQAACTDFTRTALKAALTSVVNAESSGGLKLPMWLTFVDESGVVCEVITNATNGALVSRDKWLGSRVISAQKANTANAFSTNDLSISSGALYAAVQPGGNLYGLSDSNPVDAATAYAGSASTFGSYLDTLKGKRIGGVNTFGGGLAVYKNNVKVGAIGVSGDTSCTDHATVWQVRALVGGAFAGLGDVEKLHLRTDNTFTALGDHPSCGDDDLQAGNADLGFFIPVAP